MSDGSALPRPDESEPKEKNKPALNTKLRILPLVIDGISGLSAAPCAAGSLNMALWWNDFGLVHRPPSVLPLGYAITPGFPPPRSLPSYHAAQAASFNKRMSRPTSQSSNLHAQICRLSGGRLMRGVRPRSRT